MFARGEGWEYEALRMLENYTVTWGGRLDIVIPTDQLGVPNERFWPLIELFDPDEWASYVQTRRGRQMANPARFEASLQADVENWIGEHGGEPEGVRTMLTEDHLMTTPLGPWPPPEGLTKELTRRTSPAGEDDKLIFKMYSADCRPGHHLVDICDLRPLPDVVTTVDDESLPACLRLLLAMTFGRLSPSSSQLLAQQQVEIRKAEVSDPQIPSLLQLAWFGKSGSSIEANEVLDRSPFHLSTVGCQWMHRRQPGLRQQPLTIVVGDTANDFYYAMALERCGMPTLWLPNQLTRGRSPLTYEALHVLARGLRVRRSQSDTSPISLTSLSLGRDQLDRVRRRLRKTAWGSDLHIEISFATALPKHWISALLDPTHFDDVIDEPFELDQMTRRLTPAVPSAVTSDDPWKLTWWVEVDDPERPLPARAALNQDVVAEPSSFRTIARSGRSGVCFFSHSMGLVMGGSPLSQMVERPVLRFPSTEASFRRLFESAGYQMRESPAGRFHRFATDLWGGLDELASDLSDPQTLALLRAWLSTADSGDSPGVLSMTRRYLSFEDGKKAGNQSTSGLRTILDRYVTRGILRRGLMLKCESCLHFGWYPLEALGQHFECERCETNGMIVAEAWRGGDEPSNYYGMAEVVYQALRGNSEVPVRALSKLADESRSFGHVPEVELTGPSGTKLEIDLLAVSDGRIILGEAKVGGHVKKAGPKERAWLAKFSEVASAIAADEVVFATANRWTDRTKKAIEDAFADTKPTTVRILEQC